MRGSNFTVCAALLTSGSLLATPGWTQTRETHSPVYTVEQTPASHRVRAAAAGRHGLGGGFIEFLFTGDDAAPRRGGAIYGHEFAPGGEAFSGRYDPSPAAPARPAYATGEPAHIIVPEQRALDPKYEKQTVEYSGKEKPGTVIIDTPRRFLYLVQDHGKALRYGIGVGRPGFSWSGVKTVSAKREWPDWRPPTEMLARRPDLPRFMKGGPDNPLGARALYLGSSLYRIHGSNEPWTIGTAVSSGCIRMRNEDVIDLYDRVPVGARVVVI